MKLIEGIVGVDFEMYLSIKLGIRPQVFIRNRTNASTTYTLTLRQFSKIVRLYGQ